MTSHSYGWLVSDGAKVILCLKPPLLAVWCVHVSVFPIRTLAYKWVMSFVIKNSLILSFMHNIFNLRDTEIDIYTI